MKVPRTTSAIEQLARRICWLEFGKPLLGNEDRAYWRDLPQETRDKFLEEAHRFIWLDGRLAENVSSIAILDRARFDKAAVKP